jgi:uncharacterized protein YndB with AHSA1/START domain
MAETKASVEIDAPLADVWELYFDPARWASWVDGFAAVDSSEGYPDLGGELVWRSTPAGRGRVSERVVEHRPRSLHRIEFVDPAATGSLTTTFAMQPAAEGRLTRVEQRLEYSLLTGGPLRPITDLLFIRPQMRRSLERSLAELRLEAERSGVRSQEV